LRERAIARALDAIVFADPEGKVIYANDSMARMWGYDYPEEIMGMFAGELIQSVEEGSQLFEKMMKQGGAVGETIARKKDGSFFDIQIGINLIEGDMIDQPIVMGSAVDITERKAARKALVEERVALARRVEERTSELRQANAELARADRLKDEFLASMSHELRTPLNTVLGMTEALQEEVYGPLTEKQSESMLNIEESGRHLLDLITDILDVAKINAEKIELEIGPVTVQSLCESSLRLIKEMAQKKRLKVSTNLDVSVPTIMGDERRLKQILVNLLSNAVKFTPEGGKVGLDVEGDPERKVVRVSVWDTGIGIAEEDMQLLFKPFVQLDSSLSRKYAGTGLGLALVSQLTELHGGSVLLQSKVDDGSRFTVTLPLEESGDERTTEEASPGGMEPGDIETALVIEDSPESARQLDRYLSGVGIRAQVYPRGEGAMEEALGIQPDVILLDIMLPEMHGWDVLRKLKEEPGTKDIPVIIISMLDEKSKGLKLGAAAYLVKPVSRAQFEKTLLEVVHREPECATALVVEMQSLVLLAEDNESNIRTMSNYLEAKGHKIAVARNGVEAIEMARDIRPSLILMDIQMPVMDGLEATRRIRADEKTADIPIIALTALAMPGDRERCLEAGANEYLSKPIRLQELDQKIREYMEARAANEEGKNS
jgi:PAS domain S-box-containing protein